MPSGSVKSDDFAWQISCFNSLPRPSVRTAHSTARARGSWVPPRSFRCYRVRDKRCAWRKLSSACSRPPACHSQTARRAQASALTSRPQARKPHHPRRLTLHRQQPPPPPQLLSRPRQKFVTPDNFALPSFRTPPLISCTGNPRLCCQRSPAFFCLSHDQKLHSRAPHPHYPPFPTFVAAATKVRHRPRFCGSCESTPPPAFTWFALAAFFDFVKFRGTSKQGATPSSAHGRPVFYRDRAKRWDGCGVARAALAEVDESREPRQGLSCEKSAN